MREVLAQELGTPQSRRDLSLTLGRLADLATKLMAEGDSDEASSIVGTLERSAEELESVAGDEAQILEACADFWDAKADAYAVSADTHSSVLAAARAASLRSRISTPNESASDAPMQ
jgi:hypothetical protein